MAATYDDRELLERMLANMRSFVGTVAKMARGASLLRRDGVVGSVVPTAPDRSVFNAVVYERPDALAAALDGLAAGYEAAGVRAWTVWVPHADAEASALLERAGHALDARPAAMAFALNQPAFEASEPLDWSTDGGVATLARINDDAYGLPERPFAAALAALPGDATRLYFARVGGVPASCVMTHDRDGDCGIYFVATEPDAQGRGLAGGLLGHALAEARSRGCETSSLQATAKGEPVYARLGYRNLGPIDMWERRSASGRGTPAGASR